MRRGFAGTAMLVGVAVILGGLLGAEAGGPPFWRTGSPNPWLIAVSVGVFCLLFSVPFGLRQRTRRAVRPDRSGLGWGRELAGWLAVSLLVAAAGGWMVGSVGIDAGRLSSMVGLILIVEGLLCAGVIVALLVGGS